ncbi:BMP family lipoprotein [Nocardioides mesophilus]|uniref:BMP family ABC transporter substrate-binding protein n=1 Tax=Nocardioides mesophilus TaxID=433659 RepID=A0A7G9RDN5_9ACTN|nr:BMP family ABC transporter substrate-binding protein [Nocardioides mesophilus]QNN53710.1 BMP family ABC transporter substrate-binding protein [Nocardioides mesophilus]
MKKTARVAALIGAAALTLAGCGDRGTATESTDTPAESTSSSSSAPAQSNPDFKACMVSDSGGFNDKSFNQTSHDGLVQAKTDLGITTAEVESQSDSEYADNIDALVQQNCNSITTVGFLLGEATEKSAKANPDIDYSIVDFAYDKPAKNLKGLVFNTAEPSYLAGYLAAGMSKTGTVGTFGGLNIPTVTSFMTGYVQGVEKFNEDNDADVQVVGWDPKTQKGSFTEDFEDKTKGLTVGQNMIQQGVDVIFPVAGPAGLGGLQAAQDNDAYAIWVDTDGCESAAEFCDTLLTSVVKGMDVAVEQAITDSLEGKFTNEPYVGTLANDGVGIAPYHDLDAEVPQDLKDKVEELKQQIISGELKVG